MSVQAGSALRRAAVGAGLLAGAWAAVQRPAWQRLDVRIGDALCRSTSPLVDEAVIHTTDLGSLYAVTGMAATLGALGRRRQALDVVAVGGLAWFVAQASKTRVGRERPYELHGVRRLIRPPTGSSFPSGHAAVGTALMALAAQSAPGRRSATALYTLAGYVSASRVYAGVHYPTDVVGGAGIGLLMAALWRGPLAGAGRALVRAGLRLPVLLAARGDVRRTGGPWAAASVEPRSARGGLQASAAHAAPIGRPATAPRGR